MFMRNWASEILKSSSLIFKAGGHFDGNLFQKKQDMFSICDHSATSLVYLTACPVAVRPLLSFLSPSHSPITSK